MASLPQRKQRSRRAGVEQKEQVQQEESENDCKVHELLTQDDVFLQHQEIQFECNYLFSNEDLHILLFVCFFCLIVLSLHSFSP